MTPSAGDAESALIPGCGRPATNGTAEFLRLSWNQGWLPALLLIAGTFAAYLRIWRAGFIWDDDLLLTGNPLIQAADGLRGIWFSTELPDFFPMTSTTFWLEWRLWGTNPLGYHLVNVFLHTLSAVLLWRVLARLKIPGAWLAAAMFALHPVNVESVAWIAERKNTLAMSFYALTLLGYLRFEDTGRRRWYGVAIGAFVLALLSKTAVAPLPLVLLGLAWWRRGRVERRDVWRSVPFFAVAAVLALVTIWFQYHRSIGPTIVRDDNFWSRLAGAGWAVWFYLYKAVLPVNLTFIYPRWRIEPANLLSYVPGLLVTAGLLVCWRYRREWGKAWLFSLGYFVVMLLPILGFLNISFMRYSLVADRWQYFAVLGPVTLAAAGITAALGRLGGKRPVLKPALAGLLLLVLGGLTWRQSGMYTGLETLWRTTLARNPNCAMAHTDLGNVLVQKGRVDEAITHYQQALEIQPDYELAHYNFGYLLLQKGQVDEAISHFQKALALQPDSVPAHYHLGDAFLQQGRMNEAAVQFQKALEIKPGVAEIQNSLGDVLLRQGKMDEAIVHFQTALQLQPRYPNALNNLGIALFHEGKKTEALAHFRQALEIQPDFVEAHVNLGKALLQAGQAPEALAHYRTALTLRPEDPATLSDVAWVLATWPEAAVRNGKQAVELAGKADQLSNHQDPMVLRTLAAAYAEAGQFAEAASAARRALELAGSNAVFAAELRSELKLYEAGAPARAGLTSETRNPKPE